MEPIVILILVQIWVVAHVPIPVVQQHYQVTALFHVFSQPERIVAQPILSKGLIIVVLMVLTVVVGFRQILVVRFQQNSVSILLIPKLAFPVHSVARLIGFHADFNLAVIQRQKCAVKLALEISYAFRLNLVVHRK